MPLKSLCIRVIMISKVRSELVKTSCQGSSGPTPPLNPTLKAPHEIASCVTNFGIVWVLTQREAKHLKRVLPHKAGQSFSRSRWDALQQVGRGAGLMLP